MVCATAEWQYIEYRCLYKRLKNEGRYIKLAYQELIEMYRFFVWRTAWWWVLRLHWITSPQRSPVCGTTREYILSASQSQWFEYCIEFTHTAIITFTAVLSAWECYVVDIYTESFDILITIQCQQRQQRFWVVCIWQQQCSRVEKSTQKMAPVPEGYSGIAKKRRGTKKNKPFTVVVFDLLVESNSYINLLGEHRQMVLRGASPILLGDDSIEEALCKLFFISIKHKDRNSKFSLINDICTFLLPSKILQAW